MKYRFDITIAQEREGRTIWSTFDYETESEAATAASLLAGSLKIMGDWITKVELIEYVEKRTDVTNSNWRVVE